MFYATRMRDARGSYFNLLNGYAQLGGGAVNSGGLEDKGDNPVEEGRGDLNPFGCFTKEKKLARQLARRPAKG